MKKTPASNDVIDTQVKKKTSDTKAQKIATWTVVQILCTLSCAEL